jgi:hypothetical protein
MWKNCGAAQGVAGLRATNTIRGGYRPPTEHQFHECNFDEAYHANIWATNMHRCTFVGCWASSQHSTLTSTILLDSSDVRAFTWLGGTIVNVATSCILAENVESFTVMDSTFTSWGITRPSYYSAISIYGASSSSSAHMNFVISCNQFFVDTDFATTGSGSQNPFVGIEIQSGYYNKYIVSNNLSYGPNGTGGLYGGANAIVVDYGSAVHGKYLAGNL